MGKAEAAASAPLPVPVPSPAVVPAPAPRPWTDLPNGRVAQIIVSLPDGGDRRGSGFLVARGTVLTCAHVVAGASAVRVRFNAGQPQERNFEGVLAWHDDGIDVAVLTIPAEESVRSRSFAAICPQAVQLSCEAKGFPLFKLRPPREAGRFRDLEHMHASCAPHANAREHTLDVRVADPPDPAADPREEAERQRTPYRPWSGMSGAVLFSSGRIVGVVVKHYAAEGGRVTASRADTWKARLGETELGRLEALLDCGGLDPAAMPEVGGSLPKGIRTHQQELGKRSNRHKYLTEGQVGFISPGEGHEADPDRILDRLTRLSAGDTQLSTFGIALVGVAGTGKTRTCFEVAARAQEKQWAVLHVEPNTTVSTGELVEAVVKQHDDGSDVLLVLDDLEGYAQLSLEDFLNQVDEQRPSVRLACVASVRRGASNATPLHEHFRFFERVEVCEEPAHQQAVAERIFNRVAPKAVKKYGAPDVAAACGHRPVLALLIARAIESRVRDGEEHVLSRRALRENVDLSHWLTRRTSDDLAGQRSDLLASTVAAASCPQQRHAVADAVDAFLRARGDLESGAAGVIRHLERLGWLLPPGEDDNTLEVLHDFVADELLNQALIPDGRLRDKTAGALFTAFTTSTRTFRTAATHVRRWAADLDAGTREDVQEICGQWLAAQADSGEGEPSAARLPAQFPAAGADLAETGRTLLTLLAGPPWQSAVVAAWDGLVEPWLRRVADEEPHLAHSLLADSIRGTSEDVPERLSGEALAWIRDNRERWHECRAVLEALLRATGLAPDHRAETIRMSLEWLDARGTVWRSRPLVLTETLLACEDLPEDVTEAAVVETCLNVAEAHVAVLATAPVLKSLLGRKNVSRRQTDKCVQLACRWLKRHPRESIASFVLAALLRTDTLRNGQTRWVADRAINWLADKGNSGPASFVLPPLTEHPRIDGTRAERAAALALAWLDENAREYDATFVLQPLLKRFGPDWDGADDLVRHTLDWLGEHRTNEGAHWLFEQALGNPDLLGRAAEETAEHARVWLSTGTNGTRWSASAVLAPLLGLRNLPDERRHNAAALRWLGDESNSVEEDASFVLGSLLRRQRLGPHAYDSGRLALEWLAAHPASDNVSFVLDPLLSLRDLNEEHTPRAMEFAFTWLGTPQDDPQPTARFVIPPLLRADRAGPDAAPYALAWLDEFGTDYTALHVLAPLLVCRGLTDGTVDDAVRHALGWLDMHHSAGDSTRVLNVLMYSPVPDAELRCRAIQRVFDCAEDGHAKLTSVRLKRLAKWQGPLPAAQADSLATRILAAAHGQCSNDAVAALAFALRRTDVGPGLTASLLDRGFELLGEGGAATFPAGKLLRSLLLRTDLTTARRAKTVSGTLTWLDAYQGTVYAGKVLCTLLQCGAGGHGAAVREAGVPEDRRPPDVVAMSLAWLGTQIEPRSAADARTHARVHARIRAQVLTALLERPGLTPEQEDECVRQARAWLEAEEPADGPRLAELLDGR